MLQEGRGNDFYSINKHLNFFNFSFTISLKSLCKQQKLPSDRVATDPFPTVSGFRTSTVSKPNFLTIKNKTEEAENP